MNVYTSQQVEKIEDHRFAFIKVEVNDHVMSLTLNRSIKKNALHPQMVNELAYAMHHAHFNHDIWMVVVGAVGSVFCAGADLKAMAGIIEENDSTIPLPVGDVLIAELFSKLYKPIITKITGDVYAGGFFFLAGSHIVLADPHCTLGLPEVKRGLYPFQVMAALLRVMPARKVVDWCIRGYNLPVTEAVQYGLVTEICANNSMDQRVADIIVELKANSPSAIQKGLETYDQISHQGDHQAYLFEMLQKTIMTQDGQEGLSAFREKRLPQWIGK